MIHKRNALSHYFLTIIFLFISYSIFSQGQQPIEVDKQIVAAVKKDVWIPFMESYRELDTEKLVSIHASNITRISVDLNKIEFGEDYLKNLTKLFQQIQKMNIDIDIKFSIVSSATTKNKVHQTGYYVYSTKAKDKK